MSETPGSYAGVRALQAGYEAAEHWRAVWEARAMRQATERDEARRESDHWRVLALELMSAGQREALTALSQITPDAEGWVSFATLFQEATPATWFHGMHRLAGHLKLVEESTAPEGGSRYRLTPFGARVAAALQEAARV